MTEEVVGVACCDSCYRMLLERDEIEWDGHGAHPIYPQYRWKSAWCYVLERSFSDREFGWLYAGFHEFLIPVGPYGRIWYECPHMYLGEPVGTVQGQDIIR